MSGRFGYRVLVAGLCGAGVGFGALTVSHWSKGPPASGDANFLRALPLNFIGITAYYASSLPIPGPFRGPLYRSYCSCVGCDVTEVAGNLRDFKSISDFFARRLTPESRPIDESATLVAPCDGTVIAVGQVGAYGSVEVKNVKYSIRELLGASDREPLAESSVSVTDREESGARLWYSVIHIEPGQCHRFASPGSWCLSENRRIGGYLLWLNPTLNRLYTENERLAMLGEWDHGLFCMAAVGAAGRGSLVLDKGDECFRPQLRPSHRKVSRSEIPRPKQFSPGEPIGGFRIGSAIVLVFEAPERSFRFHVVAGDVVKLGQRLATVDKSVIPSGSPKLKEQTNRATVGETRVSKFRRAW